MKQCLLTKFAHVVGFSGNRFPQTNDEADLAEIALAKELEKLSIEEHEKILFEVHGFRSNADEAICGGDDAHDANDDDADDGNDTSNLLLLESKLQELHLELENIHSDHKEAYELARFIDSNYVHDKSFLRMFLRAEMYNVKAAAELIVTHFDVKRRIFPDDVLARDIRLSDLCPEALSLLRQGWYQVLPTRDVAGRIVIVDSYPDELPKKVLDSPHSRALWYFHMHIARDAESQTKGIVYVIYNFGNHVEDVDLTNDAFMARIAIPQRVEAVHYCYKDAQLRPFVSGIPFIIPDQARYRFRPHFGTPQEIEFQLQTFGIPMEDAPMQLDCSWKTDWHREWLDMQQEREKMLNSAPVSKDNNQQETGETDCPDVHTSSQSTETVKQMEDAFIFVPRRFDVLFGRGKKAKLHTGNLRAMHLCEMNLEQYNATTKFGKTEISDRIVSIIHESEGRFLKPHKGGWVEVSDEVAREKIGHFFRHMRAKATATNNNNTTATINSPMGTTITNQLSNKCPFPFSDKDTSPIHRVSSSTMSTLPEAEEEGSSSGEFLPFRQEQQQPLEYSEERMIRAKRVMVDSN